MRVSYHPGYYATIDDNHIFPMRKFAGLHDYLLEKGIIQSSDVVSPGEVDYSILRNVHTSRYLDAIYHGRLEKKEARRLGLPWSYSLARRSRLAVQGTINAALMALQDGLAGNLAGGTHHAFPDAGEGFCVFNDVAVAVRLLQQAMWIKNAMIVDCDVHQGNGTAAIFQNDERVFTFSLHGERNFPFHKPPSTLDIGLPDKTGDDTYLQILSDTLDRILDQFSPDIVFYLGGIDPLETDHFGRLALSLAGLEKREELAISAVTKRSIPIVLLLSGGYAPTFLETVIAHSKMFAVAKRLGW